MAAQQLQDTAALEKEKEKSALLFGEVVRMGHALDENKKILHAQIDELTQKIDFQNENAQTHKEELALSETEVTFLLETKIARMQEAINAERSERQAMDAQTSEDLAHLRGKVVSTDHSIEERVSIHLDSIRNCVENEKFENKKRREEAKGEEDSREQYLVQERTQDLRTLSEQINALENLLMDETKMLQESVRDAVSENEIRFQTMTMELSKETSSRSNIQRQIEDEFHLRFGDLNEATREITAELQSDVVDLEDVIRAEIKLRMKGSDKISKRIETIVESLTKAIEFSRHEGRETQEKNTVRIDTIITVQRDKQMDMEKYVKEALSNDHLAVDMEIKNVAAQCEVLTGALSDEGVKREKLAENINGVIDDHRELTSQAIESIQRMIVLNQDEGKAVLDRVLNDSVIEMKLLSTSMNDLTEQWGTKLQTEIKTCREEVFKSVDSIKKDMADEQKGSTKNFQHIQEQFGEVDVQQNVRNALEFITNEIVDEKQKQNYTDLKSRIEVGVQLRKSLRAEASGRFQDVTDQLGASALHLTAIEEHCTARFEKEQKMQINHWKENATEMMLTDTQVKSLHTYSTEHTTQLTEIKQTIQEGTSDRADLTKALSQWKEESSSAIEDQHVISTHLEKKVQETATEWQRQQEKDSMNCTRIFEAHDVRMTTAASHFQEWKTSSELQQSKQSDNFEKQTSKLKEDMTEFQVVQRTLDVSIKDRFENIGKNITEVQTLISTHQTKGLEMHTTLRDDFVRSSSKLETEMTGCQHSLSTLDEKATGTIILSGELQQKIMQCLEEQSRSAEKGVVWQTEVADKREKLNQEVAVNISAVEQLIKTVAQNRTEDHEKWTAVTEKVSANVFTLGQSTGALTSSVESSKEKAVVLQSALEKLKEEQAETSSSSTQWKESVQQQLTSCREKEEATGKKSEKATKKLQVQVQENEEATTKWKTGLEKDLADLKPQMETLTAAAKVATEAQDATKKLQVQVQENQDRTTKWKTVLEKDVAALKANSTAPVQA